MLTSIWDRVLDFSKGFFPELGLYLLKLILIVILVVVVIEVLKAIKVLDFLNKILYFITKPLGISKSASMPLLVGFLAGITYGAGAIIASYNNGDMNKKDVILVSTFLCLCHAILEDTLLFASIGAIGIVIALIRFIVAVVVTLIVNIIYEKINKNKITEEEGKINANN